MRNVTIAFLSSALLLLSPTASAEEPRAVPIVSICFLPEVAGSDVAVEQGCKWLRESLTACGYKVKTLNNPNERALRLLQEDPDLVPNTLVFVDSHGGVDRFGKYLLLVKNARGELIPAFSGDRFLVSMRGKRNFQTWLDTCHSGACLACTSESTCLGMSCEWNQLANGGARPPFEEGLEKLLCEGRRKGEEPSSELWDKYADRATGNIAPEGVFRLLADVVGSRRATVQQVTFTMTKTGEAARFAAVRGSCLAAKGTWRDSRANLAVELSGTEDVPKSPAAVKAFYGFFPSLESAAEEARARFPAWPAKCETKGAEFVVDGAKAGVDRGAGRDAIKLLPSERLVRCSLAAVEKEAARVYAECSYPAGVPEFSNGGGTQNPVIGDFTIYGELYAPPGARFFRLDLDPTEERAPDL